MKKLLLAATFLFFAGFTNAATLSGKIFDPINNIDISDKKVKVTLSGDPAKIATSNTLDKGFKFVDYMPIDGDSLTFTKEGYIPINGAINCNVCSETSCPIECGQYIYIYDNGISSEDVIFDVDPSDPDNPDATYNIDVKMHLKPIEIISGRITAIRNDVEQELIDGSVTIKAFYEGDRVDATIDGNTYSIKEYLGTVKIPRNYAVELEYSPYEKVVKTFTVEDKKLIGKLAKDIVFTNPSNATLRQDNMEGITGFGCNELMPKYLVGANCEENNTLEGDVIDIAVWVQKFGSKITSMIGMIAVVLIVWNAFQIVTAA